MIYAPVKHNAGPRRAKFLLPLALAFYLAAPLYPIPLLGISLSLPLVLLLALKSGRLQLPRSTPLTGFLLALTSTLVLSLMVNVLAGDLVEDADASLKYIVQFGFYTVTAVLGYQLFTQPTFPPRAGQAFAFGVVVLSAFIVFENIVLGSLLSTGGWSRLTRMSQNSYAVQFSSYLPFVYYAVVTSKRTLTQSLWVVIGGFCLGAVLLNGSRTAWGTTLLTLFIFLALYTVVLRKYKAVVLTALLAPIVLFASWNMIPELTKANLERDFNTFENLEADKSWMIRQLQIQKGMKIFDESPFFGVGPAQYRNQVINLTMPDVLASRGAQEFSEISAHNSYVQFLSEGGLVFMVPYVLMLGWLLVVGARASIILARAGEVWTLALFAGLIGLSVHFWTISGLTTTGPWFLYGAMAAVISRANIAQRPSTLNQAAYVRWVR